MNLNIDRPLSGRNLRITCCCSILFVFISCNVSFGQREAVEQISLFSTRLQNPVKVDAERSDDRIIFYGVNNSFIPYRLDIEFSQVVNLDPPIKHYKTTLDPGRSKLVEMRIRDKNSSVNYNYQIRYMMGDPESKPETKFPYLIPLSKNKKADINDLHQLGGATSVLFNVPAGDTIHAMRKGKVTATPENERELDRLTPGSLEIYQHDGTLATYYSLDLISIVKPGESVYPGQSVGILKNGSVLRVVVFQFMPNNQVKPMPVNFTADGTSLLVSGQLEGVVSAHPAEIIQKELTKSEARKWQKGSLYE
jgi:hypothetical protein